MDKEDTFPATEPDEPLMPALATPAFAGQYPAGTDMLWGPYGMRAGWSLLLFFLLAVLLGIILFVGLFKATGRFSAFQREAQQARIAAAHAKAAHQHYLAPPIRVSDTLLSEMAEVGAVLLAAFALTFPEKRRIGVYGLGRRHLGDVLPGAACGTVAISLLVALLWGLHLLVFDGRLLRGGSALRYGTSWLAVFALVGLLEEFFFRGYIQFTLMRGVLGLGARISPAHGRLAAFWVAAVIWSLLFSLTHLYNAGEDPMGIVMVFGAGMLFSYALWRTGSLWWGVGFHTAWDWGQSFLFGVPDSGALSAGRLFATHARGNPLLSGGTTGPEGSVYVVPVLLLVGLVIRLHPMREQPPVEPELLPGTSPYLSPRVIP